jgi:hypothetical protein
VVEAAAFPRTYAPTLGWKVFLFGGGCAFVAAGAAIAWFFRAEPSLGLVLWMQFAGLACAALGGWLVAFGARYRMVVHRDSVEVHGVFEVRSLRKDQIAGRRLVEVRNSTPLIVIVPKDPAQRALTVSQTIRIDDEFHAWLQELPDQDALDERRFAAEVAANPELGSTPHEREQRVAKLRRMTQGLGLAATGLMLWGFVYPHPYDFVIGALAVMPIVALLVAASSKGLIQINATRGDKRPDVTMALMLPGFALALRAFLDWRILDWPDALALAAGGAAAMALVLTQVDATVRKWGVALLLFAVVGFPYAYGTAIAANVLLDESEAQRFETVVRKMHTTSGKHASWSLTIDPWGPVESVEDVEVSRKLYERLAVGDTVCVALFDGALGVRWFWVGACAK